MAKKLSAILILFFVCLIGGCQVQKNTQPPQLSQPRQLPELSAWAVYWDMEGALRGIEKLGEQLVSLQYFAAYFDAENQLFIPQPIQLQRGMAAGTGAGAGTGAAAPAAETRAPDLITYLTVVNDRLLAGGGSVLKDKQLLYELLAEEADQKAHIAQILTLSAAEGYDGVEIDYEAIRKDMVLWQYFLDFIRRLALVATEEGLLLRVVLEPGAPFEALDFPQGPEYVIMCYNLHGPGSLPGPKANDEFLLELVQKTSVIPGRRIFALAAGGFDWSGDQVTSLTEQEALALGSRQKAEFSRDSASQALSFSYQQENTVHQVWYADGATLDHWISLLKEQVDCGIALWRLE